MTGRIALIIMIIFLLTAEVWGFATPTLVQIAPVDTIFLKVDLYGSGQEQYIFGEDQMVWLWDEGERRVLVDDLASEITALALGDLNGDLWPDLVIGTENAGAIYFYLFEEGRWVRRGEPLYLWDPASYLEVEDFNQDGWGDLAVLTSQGAARLFLSWEGKQYPFWESPANQVVLDVQVVDLNKDGYPEVIYACESGYVAILSWVDQQFVLLWENYVWGSIERLLVLDNSEGPEWSVITTQKMIYGWRWIDGKVEVSRRIPDEE